MRTLTNINLNTLKESKETNMLHRLLMDFFHSVEIKDGE